MSELCKCGHGFDQHSPYTPQPCQYQSGSTNALGSIITRCTCPAFTPARPATDDLQAGFERVLGEHAGCEIQFLNGCVVFCDSSISLSSEFASITDARRAHVAAQLVEHINRKGVCGNDLS